MLTTLRSYRPDDAQHMYPLHIRAISALGIVPRPKVANADLMSITTEYLERSGEFIIAEINGAIVGYGGYLPVDSRTIEIRRMRIDPEWQRQGIGTSILNTLISNAKRRGYHKVVLSTDIRMKAAIALYLKAGFTQMGKMVEYGEEMLVFEADMVATQPANTADRQATPASR
jgi:ribosomal protein S18 acetylase RimI-like enzyme